MIWQTLNLIILGPQGSGKGTQASLLQKRLEFICIGAGESLRTIAKADTGMGQEVRRALEAGQLVRPEIILEVYKQKFLEIPASQGVIIEGYPRTLVQYELFKTLLTDLKRGDYKVIFIELSESEALKRLSNRVVCASCGAVYIAGTATLCEKCGGRLVVRHDDHPDAVKQRFQIFYNETMPLLVQMEKEGRLIRINGEGSIAEVHAEILFKLGVR